MLFQALYGVFKSMEPLSSDSPAETDVVRSSPHSTKICVATPAGNRTQYYIYAYMLDSRRGWA